jgi:diaminopimelate epimerase
LIDNRNKSYTLSKQAIQKLTDRKFGIGADGLMLIENDDHTDFKMIYYNADGSQSLCGNGSRCAIHFAQSLGIIRDKTIFETTDGIHNAFLEGEKIHFELHDVDEIKILNEREFFVNTGSPHHIVLVDSYDSVDVVKEGSKIRNSASYPEGTNVNFVKIEKDQIFVRTYERGVEDETLSCGTGVVASAIAVSLKGFDSPIRVNTPGGNLTVSFIKKDDESLKSIYLARPEKMVYSGIIDI